MKVFYSYFIMLCFFSVIVVAQKARVFGMILDKATKEPLAFANVQIKGTNKGVMTDFDGKYEIKLVAGDYTLIYSTVGYDSKETIITLKKGQQKKHNELLSESKKGIALESVLVKTKTVKNKETALLAEQKGLAMIKESIGVARLSKMGISSVARATTKIAGVYKSENKGDLFVRGLSDRYIATTMNRLPIPSDDVAKKNIDLGLFGTQIIENVALSKTYNTANYGDQSAGNIDITSKVYHNKKWNVNFSGGVNQNILGVDFRTTTMQNNVKLGFYKGQNTPEKNITAQGWDPTKTTFPINYNIGLSKSHKWTFQNNGALSFFLSLSQGKSNQYQKGIFKAFRANVLRQSFTDTEVFKTIYNNTALLNVILKINNAHQIGFNHLFIYKSIDNLFEQGRNSEGFVYDQDPKETEAFNRDQNLKTTLLSVQQITGKHIISEAQQISWAVGYNYLSAGEPNRIRNQLNIYGDKTVQFAHVGDFQQRKSSQHIKDFAYNGYIENQWGLQKDDDRLLKINMGANFQMKKRNFDALFVGVRAKGMRNNDGIDALSTTFTKANFENGSLTLRMRKPDIYTANFNVFAGYINANFQRGKFSGTIGLRYEYDQIKVQWDVANYVGRIGNTEKRYHNFLPAINLKYELNEKQILRMSFSKTNTLPEFKELSPFEYVSPNGRVSKGNESLEKSDNYNIDLKWSFFPSAREILSVTAFYKHIQNPINLIQMQGSSGYFQYNNTGDQAKILGVEMEARFTIFRKNEKPILSLGSNISWLFLEQDLLRNYQYSHTKKTALEGATPFIFNGNLTYETHRKKPLILTFSVNYTADKIIVLGAPEDFKRSDVLFNDQIIGKGFLRVDMTAIKNISKNLSIKINLRNLTNPSIEQTQNIRNLTTGVTKNETVSQYQNGIQGSLGLRYSF